MGRVLVSPGPTVIGERDGEPVWSCIDRLPLPGRQLVLTADGIVGDHQHDRRPHNGGTMHGGPDKALLAMPAFDRRAWKKWLGDQLTGRHFGENLQLGDPDDPTFNVATIRIGDQFVWGSLSPDRTSMAVVLKVTKPRTPCTTLAAYLGVPDLLDLAYGVLGPPGFYMSVAGVLEPGSNRLSELPSEGVRVSTSWPMNFYQCGSGPTVQAVFGMRPLVPA